MLKICRIHREGPIAPSRFAGSRRLPVGRRRLDPHLERHPALPDGRPEERVDGGGNGQAELVQDGLASFLASGSIWIVVAGMFDGMAAPSSYIAMRPFYRLYAAASVQ